MGTPSPISTTRTTTQLLDALREPSNEPAWAQIDSRYRPVIAGLARRLGLSPDAAEEVAQNTLAEFVHAYREGRYDRSKGRLSSWILGIAHHTTLKAMRDGKRSGSKSGSLSQVPDEPSLRSIWDQERDRAIVSRALAILRDESNVGDRTLDAFELVALRGVPAHEAAAQCGMTIEQVYVSKTRVTKRLRAVVEHLTHAFEEDV